MRFSTMWSLLNWLLSFELSEQYSSAVDRIIVHLTVHLLKPGYEEHFLCNIDLKMIVNSSSYDLYHLCIMEAVDPDPILSDFR